MGSKQLVCAMVEDDKKIFDFKNTSHEYKFINWARKFRQLKNQVINHFSFKPINLNNI